MIKYNSESSKLKLIPTECRLTHHAILNAKLKNPIIVTQRGDIDGFLAAQVLFRSLCYHHETTKCPSTLFFNDRDDFLQLADQVKGSIKDKSLIFVNVRIPLLSVLFNFFGAKHITYITTFESEVDIFESYKKLLGGKLKVVYEPSGTLAPTMFEYLGEGEIPKSFDICKLDSDSLEVVGDQGAKLRQIALTHGDFYKNYPDYNFDISAKPLDSESLSLATHAVSTRGIFINKAGLRTICFDIHRFSFMNIEKLFNEYEKHLGSNHSTYDVILTYSRFSGCVTYIAFTTNPDINLLEVYHKYEPVGNKDKVHFYTTAKKFMKNFPI